MVGAGTCREVEGGVSFAQDLVHSPISLLAFGRAVLRAVTATAFVLGGLRAHQAQARRVSHVAVVEGTRLLYRLRTVV